VAIYLLFLQNKLSENPHG